MLTLQNLRDHVSHALGNAPDTTLPGATGDPSATTADKTRDMIINSAGKHLFSMHDWEFRHRPTTTLDFHAGQDYVTMPGDFGGLIDVRLSAGTYNSLTLTTPAKLSDLRTSTTGAALAGDYWCALSWPAQTDPSVAQPKPRLEFWPAISASSVGAITLDYYASWVQLKVATDAANIPAHADTLLVQLVRAFALGWEDEAVAPLELRIQAIEQGPVFQRVKEVDGMAQPQMGRMGGGAIGFSDSTNPWILRAKSPVSGPT